MDKSAISNMNYRLRDFFGKCFGVKLMRAKLKKQKNRLTKIYYNTNNNKIFTKIYNKIFV